MDADERKKENEDTELNELDPDELDPDVWDIDFAFDDDDDENWVEVPVKSEHHGVSDNSDECKHPPNQIIAVGTNPDEVLIIGCLECGAVLWRSNRGANIHPRHIV